MDLTDEIEAALLTNLENKDGIDITQIVNADAIYAINTAFDQIYLSNVQEKKADDEPIHNDVREENATTACEEEEKEFDIHELLAASMGQKEQFKMLNFTEEEKKADDESIRGDVRKENATVAWEEDMKQQDESVRLQLAAMKLYVEDRTIDVDPSKKVSIIHDDEVIEKACTNTVEECTRVLGLDNIREIVMACQMPYEARFAVFMLLKTLHRVIDMVTLDACLLRQCEQDRTYACRVTTGVLMATPLTEEVAQDTVELFEPLSIRFNRQISRGKTFLYSLSMIVEKS